MRNILIVGAGKSTAVLIEYLLEKATSEDLFITIADLQLESAGRIIGKHPRGKAMALDIFQKEEREKAIQEADIVISMLPASLHIEIAKDCLKFNKNMVTASYGSRTAGLSFPQK